MDDYLSSKKLKTNTQSNTLVQIISSHPNWLQKMLSWVTIDSEVFYIKKLNFSGTKDKPKFKSLDILKDEGSYFLSDLLRRVPIFKSLPEDMLKEVLDGIYQKNVNAGDVLIKEGDIGKSFYIILQGEFEVKKKEDGGSDLSIKALTGGDYFGEMALLGKDVRTATITAKTKGSLIVLNQETFKKVIGNSELKNQLQRIFEEREKELMQGGREFNEDEFVSDTKVINALELNIIETNFTVATGDNANSIDVQKEVKQFLEKIGELEEREIINNPKYGILANISPKMWIDKKGLLALEDFDQLLSLVWDRPSFFLAHPKAISAFLKDCSKNKIIPSTINKFGNEFISWRGVPIVPSEQVPLSINDKVKTTSVILLRTGEENNGVVGIQKKGIYGLSDFPDFPLRCIKEDKNFNRYKVSRYISIALLSENAAGVLRVNL